MISVSNAFVLIHLLVVGLHTLCRGVALQITPQCVSSPECSSLGCSHYSQSQRKFMTFLPAMPVSGLFPGQWVPFQSSEDSPGNALGPSLGLGPEVAEQIPLLLLFLFEVLVGHSVCVHSLLLQGNCGIRKPETDFRKEERVSSYTFLKSVPMLNETKPLPQHCPISVHALESRRGSRV